MLIKLVNFLCHKDSTFEFDKSGLHLLKGLNGTGKSTILKGIYFAFYGTIRKPYSHGAESCKVEYDTNEIHIVRSRSPNRLVVSLKDSKVTEEDETAQELIYKFLRMTNDQFLLSSYIRPHSRTSLVTLTPMEQLRMIESFTFQSDIHETHRREILDLIKKTKEELVHSSQKTTSSEEYYKTELAEFKAVDYKCKKCTIKQEDLEQIKTTAAELKSELKTKKAELVELKAVLKAIDGDKDLVDIEKRLKEQQLAHSVAKKQLETLLKAGPVQTKSNVKMLEDDLEKLEELIETCTTRFHIEEKMKQFNQLKDEYFKDVEKELKGIEPTIIKDEETVTAYEKQIMEGVGFEAKNAEYTKKRRELIFLAKKNGHGELVPASGESSEDSIIIENFQLLESELQSKKKAKETEIDNDRIKKEQNKPYNCPECNVKVVLRTDGLHKHTEIKNVKTLMDEELAVIRRDIDDLDRKLSVVTKILTGFSNLEKPPVIEGNLDEIKHKYEQHKSNYTKYKTLRSTLDNSTLSSTLIKIKKGIPESPLKRSLPTVFETHTKSGGEKSNSVVFSEKFLESHDLNGVNGSQTSQTALMGKLNGIKDMLAKLINECTQRFEYHTQIKSSITSAEKEIALIEMKLETSRGVHGSRDEIVEKISELTAEVDTLKEQIEEGEKSLTDYDEYQRYKTHFLKVKRLKETYMSNKEETDLNSQRYNAALLLEKKHKEAEIMSIEGVMSSINELAAGYLDVFFESEPISVTCEIMKKTKTDVKLKINTNIFYKGAEYTSYEELSQGELVKVNLSYILALNTYFGSDLLMLDEFLENLDSEVAVDVIDKLKSLSKDKCIIIIDHSAIEGVYDNILQL